MTQEQFTHHLQINNLRLKKTDIFKNRGIYVEHNTEDIRLVFEIKCHCSISFTHDEIEAIPHNTVAYQLIEAKVKEALIDTGNQLMQAVNKL